MKRERLDESREILVRAFMFAFGSYVEQEAKKEDNWREREIGELYFHLAHEVEEIRHNLKRSEAAYLVHNAADTVMLSLMLLSKALDCSLGVSDREKDDDRG